MAIEQTDGPLHVGCLGEAAPSQHHDTSYDVIFAGIVVNKWRADFIGSPADNPSAVSLPEKPGAFSASPRVPGRPSPLGSTWLRDGRQRKNLYTFV